jgi:hypothetical protein
VSEGPPVVSSCLILTFLCWLAFPLKYATSTADLRNARNFQPTLGRTWQST